MWCGHRVQRDEPRQSRPPGGGVLDGRTALVENSVRVERRGVARYVRVSVSRRCGRCASRLGRAELVRAVELPDSASLCGRTIVQRNIAHGRKGAGSRPRWWAHLTLATRIAREREPTSGLRLEMTVSPDEDKAGVQFLVSELVHEVIALVGGPPTNTGLDGRGWRERVV